MTKAVVQYLRGLDLSSVTLGSCVQRDSKPRDVSDEPSQTNVNVTCCRQSTEILSSMCRLQWLKLRNVGLTQDHLPTELDQLQKLESLSLSRNSLTRLTHFKRWPTVLPALRSLTCRKNDFADGDAIPPDIFECPHLQVIDFSCNHLTSVPKGIEKAKGLLVLNLSQNMITTVPAELFVQCTDLMLLDLSENQIESLPAQLRRCSSLQQLILSRNPLHHAHLRSVAALKHLEVLHLAGTLRRVDNIPVELDRLERLSELDLSENFLSRIPDPVLSFRSLRKLSMEQNELSDLSQITDNWPKLEYFNVGHNRLVQLPSGLTRLTSLRKLYVNNNQLTFVGIPSGIGKLVNLEIFDASFNQLENIPESLCRCGRLKRLNLNCNRLLTLPDAIHYLLENLDLFDVDNNPQLRFPPKPIEQKKGAGLAYYNIDFSLEAQLRKICGKPVGSTDGSPHAKDVASRLRRLRRRRGDGASDDSQCVLEGMQRIARDKDALLRRREQEEEEETKLISAKRWKDQLSKPQLDYTGIFEEDTGTLEGVEMWELDEFYPKRVEEDCVHGRLFDGDCYIVLHTKRTVNHTLDWTIYYWIGEKAALDKQTCAAIHAVNLRNFLGAEGRTYREGQNDESDEFLALFGGNLMVLEGARGETGFFHVEEQVVVPKLYRLFGLEKRLQIVSMLLSPFSLDPKFCYLIDAHSKLFLWLGSQSRLMVRTKGRLLAEMISVRERRGEAKIHLEPQGRESNMFWAVLTGVWTPPPLPNPVTELDKKAEQELEKSPPPIGSPPPEVPVPENVPKDFIPAEWTPPQPILYDVRMGKGYLELPQVDVDRGFLTKNALDSKHVYLLDSGGELFVWMGKKSARFLRTAGFKLAQELVDLMPRCCFVGPDVNHNSVTQSSELPSQVGRSGKLLPQLCTEGAENQIFRAQFSDWEEPLAVDFTRTFDSVTKRGLDIHALLEKDKPNVDLRALLTPRERSMEWNEAIQLMSDWNEELVEPIGPDLEPTSALQQFIMVDGKWIPVEPRWFGHFFNQDSYIVIARYWDFNENVPADDPDCKEKSESPDDDDVDRTKAVVYFWQGREASDLHWLTFNFSVRKEMAKGLSINPHDDSRPLEVEFKRLRQQQEDLLFLSHFQRQFVVHKGRYANRNASATWNRIQMYYIRANGNAISTRSIEVSPSATHLNSCFSYLIKVPPDTRFGESRFDRTHVWIWIGKDAHPDDQLLANKISKRIFNQPEVIHEVVFEGTEPSELWASLGGQKKYDHTASFLTYGRLFRLSNDQGYFCASEKCSDFCQDDLADDDVMMLDTGEQIYLWWGKRTSDVEQKLSLQAAKLYQQHLSNVQRDRPRQMKLTAKNLEPHMFKRCFHGWGPFREPKDWSG